MQRPFTQGLELRALRLRLRAALLARAARHPTAAGRALRLDQQAQRLRPAPHQGAQVLEAWVPAWPSPAFDRWLEGALGLNPDYRPLALVDADGEEGRAAVRATLSAWAPPGVLILRGEKLWSEPDELVALVAEAALRAEVWLLSSGRRLTASLTQRLSEAGLHGLAVSFYAPLAAEQDQVWGRKSWDESVTALGLAAQAGLLSIMVIEARSELFERDLCRDLHQLGRECGAAFLVLAVPSAGSALVGPSLAFQAARQGRPAFADYPGVSVFGVDPRLAVGHWAAPAFLAPLPVPLPSPALRPDVEPEPEPTGLDLPPPLPYHQHRAAKPAAAVGGGVIEALRRRNVVAPK